MSPFPLLFAVVLFAGPAALEQEGADAPLLEIEEFESVSEFEPVADPESPPQPQPQPIEARVYGTVRGWGGIDTKLESTRADPLAEDVFELSTRAILGVDAKLSSSLRVLAEARGWWRAAAEREFDRPTGTLELEVGEAFVDLYSPAFDLRVGNQIVAFGANPAFAPADQLNPRDLRESLLLGEPVDLKLPSLGVRALGSVGKVSWTAAYFPFFKPNRYAPTGVDEVDHGLVQRALEAAEPRAFPWLGDVGLRATTEVGPLTVGASWIWINEKTPAVELEPELIEAVRARVSGEDRGPPLASLLDRAMAGERLATGRYGRQHLLSLEAQTLVSTAQLDLDLSWSPAQTLYDAGFQPIRMQTLSWALGVSQATDSPLLYSVSWLGMVVPGLASEDYLLLLEPGAAAGAPGTVWVNALIGTVGYRFLSDRLEVSVRAAVEPMQRSWALSPRVTWKAFSQTTVGLAAELYEGRPWSPFGHFGRNDQVVALFSTELLP